MKKLKAGLPFILLLIFVLAVQFFNFLESEQNSNHESWSRSVNLELETDNRSPLMVTTDEGIDLYTSNNGIIQHQTVKPDLTLQKQTDIKAPIGSQDSFWTNGSDVMYAKNNTLTVLTASGESKILLEGVQQFKANESLAVAVTDNEIFTINTKTFEPVKLSNLAGKVEDLVVTLDTNSFVTATNADASILTFTLYQFAQSKWSVTELFQYDTNLDSYAGVDYSIIDGTLHIIYTSTSRKGGGDLQIANFYAKAPLASLPGELAFNKLKIYDGENQLPLIKNFNIVKMDEKVNLLFASTNEVNDRELTNVFKAELDKEKWTASRIGTSDLQSSKPVMVGEGLITWLDFDAKKDIYYVMGASTNEKAIASSLELTKTDYVHAVSRTIFSLSGALIFLAVSFLVLIPPTVLLIGMNYFNVYNKTRFMWMAIASYFITQFYFIQRFFDSPSISFGPFFINFSYSQFILPLVTAALAFLLYFLVRNKEWSEEVNVVYIVSLHMFMMVIMVGPFVF
ncbi:hypothetical protein [Bacillus suaedaesalsae]|uniref:Uncharacterized protein n=1 Tax=Bacillus suaedaesalsae TaxID=2810349 RepID=A0ABS2DEG0_9BACI|nr:hypothetical protein [Bacillus suaedaesalsae]MBM6616833.1 hypothetical protein [Bacillus suaedaesalsae]